jgi:hypothetical protein
MTGAQGLLTTEVSPAMLSLLRSSVPLALTLTALALGSTGCAAKLGGSARLSVPSPSVSVHTYGNASASASTSAQAQVGAQAYGGAQAQGAGQFQYGGSCAPAVVVAAPVSAPPAPPREPWRPAPVFYGVPLENAQDVIFVLDRSSSMTESDGSTTSGVPNPFGSLSVLISASASAAATIQVPPAVSALQTSPLFAGLPGLGQITSGTRTKLDVAKAELTGAIAGLPDGTRYNVVFFGDTVAELSPQLVSLNPMSRVGSMIFVQGIHADGMTAAVPALRAAYASHPRRVVFLSDGLANVDGDGNQLLAEARVQMRNGVRFDTVGVGADQDRPLMAALAQQSGGISTSR